MRSPAFHRWAHIIYISGDDGSSAEGTLTGTPSEIASLNGVNLPVEDQIKYFYDFWGSDTTYPHMAVPWTRAFDTRSRFGTLFIQSGSLNRK